MIIKSNAESKKLSAYDKGYMVYMCGSRDDEPHVPRVYHPKKKDEKRYNEGSFVAMIATQDGVE